MIEVCRFFFIPKTYIRRCLYFLPAVFLWKELFFCCLKEFKRQSNHLVSCSNYLCLVAIVYKTFLSAMFVIADTLKEKLRASGSNMRAHVVHALYSSFFFCNTPLIWLCMKAVAKDLGCVLLLDSE